MIRTTTIQLFDDETDEKTAQNFFTIDLLDVQLCRIKTMGASGDPATGPGVGIAESITLLFKQITLTSFEGETPVHASASGDAQRCE